MPAKAGVLMRIFCRYPPFNAQIRLPPVACCGVVNPAKHRTFGRVTNHLIPFHSESAAYIVQPLAREFWIVWPRKNKGCSLFGVTASTPGNRTNREPTERARKIVWRTTYL